MSFNEKIFWVEDFSGGLAQGGIFTRSFELKEFLERVEESDKQIVGLKFDGNNLEILTTYKDDQR